jgi:hypothetical protein
MAARPQRRRLPLLMSKSFLVLFFKKEHLAFVSGDQG